LEGATFLRRNLAGENQIQSSVGAFSMKSLRVQQKIGVGGPAAAERPSNFASL
jgi:hypothetical protein